MGRFHMGIADMTGHPPPAFAGGGWPSRLVENAWVPYHHRMCPAFGGLTPEWAEETTYTG